MRPDLDSRDKNHELSRLEILYVFKLLLNSHLVSNRFDFFCKSSIDLILKVGFNIIDKRNNDFVYTSEYIP